MTSIDTIMKGPRSKIERANRHIDELRRRSSPLDRSLYEIVNPGVKERRTVIDLHPTRYRVTFRPKKDIPDVFAGIIGDAFNNIREAFDYAAAVVVDTWGERPAGPLYFPMAPRKDLVAHSGLTAIEKAAPGFKELFLKDIRPENGPNEHLWDFYTLHRDGKHNDFVPVVMVVGVKNINAAIGTNRFINCGISFNTTRPRVLFDADTPIAIQNDFQTSVDILFGERTVFKNEPVIPTLSQIAEVATEALNVLERHIVATKFS